MIQIRTSRPVSGHILGLVAIIAAGLVAQPALADTPKAPTAEVKLDAATLRGGDARINARIAEAARRVCRAENMSVGARMAARDCYKQAIEGAQAQVVALRQTAHAPQQALAATDTRPVR